MPYNNNLELPEFKKENAESCTYTHNHPHSYFFSYHKWDLEARKKTRVFIENSKKEINRCIFFINNCLQDKELTDIQKAILKQSIENDKAIIEAFDNEKPSACTIL